MTQTIASVIDELTYRSYRHNRNLGCTADQFRLIYSDGLVDVMERRYQGDEMLKLMEKGEADRKAREGK